MKRLVQILSVAGLVGSLYSGAAIADAVSAQSYTFDQMTSCGSWCYHDPSFTKLTDGVVGNAGWATNSGSEWDGWLNKSVVNIDFHFATETSFTSVSIGSTQDNLGDVALPSFAVYGKVGGTWQFESYLANPPTSANNVSAYSLAPHNFYTLSMNGYVGQDVRVAVLANGPWSFVDEVRFQGATVAAPVPEPETYAMMLAGLGILGGLARRRKAKQRSSIQ